ncbi:MAG: tetratricopeptide repeat protein [Gammaproteobacteria bacterium]|nr:tetratricopeptide repeat protein [Gammaproteobacteria bacterium]
MLTDRYDLAISTHSEAARDTYIVGCDCILSAAPGGAEALMRAVTADPRFALAYAALAREHFLFGNVVEARRAATEARARSAGASAREQSHVHALCLPIEGKPVDAFAATQAHLDQYPRDAMVAAPATGPFGLIGFSGRPGREAEQLAFLAGLKPQLAEDWWFQMAYGFALGETGQFAPAQTQIERSLTTNPRNAHGVHAKTHLLYETGEDAVALDYLESWLADYAREGLLHCHLSWHLALLSLSLGKLDAAWRIYQQQVHPGGAWGPALNIATDAVAFLWRAELAGEKRRGNLWREIHAYALEAFPKVGIAFVDVHKVLACITAGDVDGLARIHQELAERVAAGRYPVGGVVPTLARGLEAYAKGQWSMAIDLLAGARPETVRIGGSRAQRDLIDSTLLAAYLKDGRIVAAQAMLADRNDRQPSNPVAGLA